MTNCELADHLKETSLMSTLASQSLLNLAEHERLAAERLKWWAVYLIYEERRLQSISNAVARGSDGQTRNDPRLTTKAWDDTNREASAQVESELVPGAVLPRPAVAWLFAQVNEATGELEEPPLGEDHEQPHPAQSAIDYLFSLGAGGEDEFDSELPNPADPFLDGAQAAGADEDMLSAYEGLRLAFLTPDPNFSAADGLKAAFDGQVGA